MSRRLDLPWGYIELHNNEVSLVSTEDDPPKIRQACASGGLGALSFNKLRADGGQEEVVLLQGKLREDFRAEGEGNLSGELSLHLRNHHAPGNEDAQMLRSLIVTSDAWEFYAGGKLVLRLDTNGPHTHIPESPHPPAGTGTHGPRMPHEGDFVTIFQGDGNIVTYATFGSADESTWQPIWSSWYGRMAAPPRSRPSLVSKLLAPFR